MKIVKPTAEIIQIANGTSIMIFIESAARISHGSESLQTQDSWKRFIQNVVIDHGDWSVVEHVSISVKFTVDRGITHELVRHRLFSFTQSSTRFINYAKSKMGVITHPAEFIYPRPDVECVHCLNGNEPGHVFDDTWGHDLKLKGPIQESVFDCEYDDAWLYSIAESEKAYVNLVSRGWSPQFARSVFPNALASTIQMTGNLRNWRHFFIMRTTAETHPQMKQVTVPLLEQFKERVPLMFDDIRPGERQVESMRKAR